MGRKIKLGQANCERRGTLSESYEHARGNIGLVGGHLANNATKSAVTNYVIEEIALSWLGIVSWYTMFEQANCEDRVNISLHYEHEKGYIGMADSFLEIIAAKSVTINHVIVENGFLGV